MTDHGINTVAQAQDIANALATALKPFGLENVTLGDLEVSSDFDISFMRPRTIVKLEVCASAARVPIAYPKVTPAPEDETTSDWHFMGVDPETGEAIYARAGAGRKLEVYRPSSALPQRFLLGVDVPAPEGFRPAFRRFPSDDGDEVLVLERDCS